MAKKRYMVEATKWAKDWLNKLVKMDSKGSPIIQNQKAKLEEAIRALLKSRKIEH